MRGDTLEVRVKAPPKGGAANAALVKLLAKHFNVPASHVSIINGGKSRYKRVAIKGVNVK